MDWKRSELFVVTFEGWGRAFIIKIPICFHYNGAIYWWYFASDVLWMSDYTIIMIKQHLLNWFPLLTIWSLWECVIIHAWPFFSESNGCCYVANKVINTSRPRQNSIAAILQKTLSNAFSRMNMLEFRLQFRWSSFLRVQSTIFQHWVRKWLGADQATSHYLN